jgi:hypothetical protein
LAHLGLLKTLDLDFRFVFGDVVDVAVMSSRWRLQLFLRGGDCCPWQENKSGEQHPKLQTRTVTSKTNANITHLLSCRSRIRWDLVMCRDPI